MIEIWQFALMDLLGCFLIVGGIIFLSRLAYKRGVRWVLVISLCLILVGTAIHIFYSKKMHIAQNLGMPMEIKDLAEDKEFEIMMLTAGVAVIGLEDNKKAEIRLVWNFPEKLPIGTKCVVINGKVIPLSQRPKELPKIEI